MNKLTRYPVEIRERAVQVQDWCVMPYLDILYTPKQLFRSTIKIGGDLQAYEAQNGETLLVPAGVLHNFEPDECEM